MRRIHLFWGVLLFTLGTVACAAGGAPVLGSDPGQDPVLRSAKDGISRQDWAGTQAILKKAIAANPGNADYHNLYAFAVRKGPNPDMKLVIAEYMEALRISPRNKGAREYLGEAYLQMNDPAKAKEQLDALDKICTLGCSEYSDLKEAIHLYESTHPH